MWLVLSNTVIVFIIWVGSGRTSHCGQLMSAHLVILFFSLVLIGELIGNTVFGFWNRSHWSLSHGSSSNCLAVFLSSGRHCNMPLMKSKNRSLFTPSRTSSICSKLVPRISTSAFHRPDHTNQNGPIERSALENEGG